MELTIQTDTISSWKHKMRKLWTTGIFRRKETKQKSILPGASKAISLPSRAHGFTLGFWWGLCCASFYFSVLRLFCLSSFCVLSTTIFQLYISVEKIVVSGKNHRPAPCHCQTLSQNVVPSTPHYKQYLNTHGIALVALRIFDSIHVRHTNKPEACMMY